MERREWSEILEYDVNWQKVFELHSKSKLGWDDTYLFL